MEKTLPEFTRSVVTTLTGTYGDKRCPFTVTVTNSTDAADPPGWRIALSDYENGVGAVGEFPTEEEALANMAAFLELALPLYRAKHGKYGPAPVITPGPEGLDVRIPPRWGEG